MSKTVVEDLAAADETRELMIRMRDDAAANGDHRGALELDEAILRLGGSS